MEFWDGWFTRWKEPVIQGSQRSWLHMRSWSLAPSISFIAEPISALWMGAQLRERPSICHRWRLLDYRALLNEQGNQTEVLCYSKMMAAYYRNTHSRNRSSKSVCQNKPCNWQPRLVFLGIWTIWLRLRPAFIPKRWKGIRANHRLSTIWDRPWVGCGRRRKTAHHWWSGSNFNYLDDRHVATLYKQRSGWRSFIKGKKESGCLKILLENMGRVNYRHKLLADKPAQGHSLQVSVDMHFHLHWKQYPLDLRKISVSSIFKGMSRCPSLFTDMIFSWTTPWYLSRYDRIWKGSSLSMAITWPFGKSDRPLHL